MMSFLPTIMLVEDDDFSAELAMEMLAADYTVRHFANGQSALDALETYTPDLVLLDASMPGLSGYDVCRRLRENQSECDLPVIFLSGLVSDEERLAGYEAGGDDYLTKPVMADELRLKISRAINHSAECKRLKSDYSSAFSTAMTAMSSAAEVGAVLQFLRTSFSCPDYVSLCREILATIAVYGLEASVQIRGNDVVVSLNQDGSCSPLEESVLKNMSMQGRIFEFSSRTSYNYDHITIIIKNMPRDDQDKYGRMKDNLALLAEGADARVITLDDQLVLAKQHNALMQLIASTRETLRDIEQHHLSQRKQSNLIFADFRDELERKFLNMGLKSSQEEELSELAMHASNRALALYDEGLAESERMEKLLSQLERAGGK